MIKYKYIHKDSGYESLLSIDDPNKSFQINRLMESIQGNVISKNSEKIYAYFYYENNAIYYKESNSLVNALIDDQNELKNNFPQAYPSEIIFNELLLPIDNSPINSLPVRPGIINIPNLLITDLQYVPLVVDSILNNKKIALIGNNVEHLKNFIKFVLYLFPVNFARKIGYVVNLAYLPHNLYQEIFENVKIFGLTENVGTEMIDVVIDLKKPCQQTTILSPFAKVLDYEKMNLLQLQRKSKELYPLFDENGNYIESKSKILLTPLIFEREKTAVNADKVLDVLLESTEEVNINVFNSLTTFIINNNLYTGSLMQKIDTLINQKPELNIFAIRFKEKKVKTYLEDLNDVTKEQLQEIITYLSDQNVNISDEIMANLNRQRTNPHIYDIIFGITINTNNPKKQIYCAEYIRFDRIYNLNINSLSFDEFFTNKIKNLNTKDEIKNISLVYLYSTIKYYNENIYQATNRKNQFIETLKQIKINRNLKYDLIFEIYDSINYLIEEDIPEQISDYFDFEFLSKEQINNFIKISKSDEKNEYVELIDYIITNKKQTYQVFYRQLLDIILIGKSSVEPNKFLYQKYINVYNYDKFIKVLELAGITNQQEYQTFLSSLQKEENISKNLAPYRLDYIYSCYNNSALTIKKRIAKKLHLTYNKDIDEIIRQYVYNDIDKENQTKIALQKQTIDTITDYVEVNDTIVSINSGNHYKKLFGTCLLALIFSILALLIFNLPVFIKTFLINKNIITIFFEYNNIVTPYVIFYSFIFYLIVYAINIKKTRGNNLQAIGRTIIKWLLFVVIPVLMYVITYLVVYFIF